MKVFTLTNAYGLELRALNYGGTIVSFAVPDRKGDVGDVVLGHDSLEDYVSDSAYFGAIIGRFANRIAGARFSVDGKTYRLTANDDANHLHGGRRGFLAPLPPYSCSSDVRCSNWRFPWIRRRTASAWVWRVLYTDSVPRRAAAAWESGWGGCCASIAFS